MIKNKNSKNISAKREKQTRFLSQAIQLEESVNPHIIRATMSMVSLALIAFIAWSGFTNINEVARTPGEIVPQGHQQTVQHLEGGIIKAIKIREGDVVEEGEVLIVLNDASIKKDLQRAQAKQLNLQMQEERLRAFIEARQPDFDKFGDLAGNIVTDQKSFFEGMRNARQTEQMIVEEQIKEKKQNIRSLQSELSTARSDLKIAQNVFEKRRHLHAKGYASEMQMLSDERSLIQAKGQIRTLNNRIAAARSEIAQYEDRSKSLSARHHDEALERLSNIEAEKAQNTEIIDKLQERIGRMSIRAPARGLIKGLSINTVGAVIQPGQTITEIVPLDKNLEVAVKISPQDIGHLKTGQPVQVKFSTFDFSRYGSVPGRLEQISATTFDADNGERYYHGRILLDKNFVGSNPDNRIMPGMTVMADIITGDKTILEYMLKPIHVSLKTAFTER